MTLLRSLELGPVARKMYPDLPSEGIRADFWRAGIVPFFDAWNFC